MGAFEVIAQRETTPFRLDVQIIYGEPRVLDTALAGRLGYENQRQIRELIKRNLEELEGFGGVVQRDTLVSGNKTVAYYLNRQQALLVCILSKTPRAREVRAEVIRRFDAYEVPAVPVAPAQPPAMDQLMGAMTALVQTIQGFVQTVTAKALALAVPAASTMSSLEIAERTGKQHGHVMRDIRAMLTELGVTHSSFGATFKDRTGRTLPCYHLPKHECLVLVTGYSIPMRPAVVDRWQEA